MLNASRNREAEEIWLHVQLSRDSLYLTLWFEQEHWLDHCCSDYAPAPPTLSHKNTHLPSRPSQSEGHSTWFRGGNRIRPVFLFHLCSCFSHRLQFLPPTLYLQMYFLVFSWAGHFLLCLVSRFTYQGLIARKISMFSSTKNTVQDVSKQVCCSATDFQKNKDFSGDVGSDGFNDSKLGLFQKF